MRFKLLYDICAGEAKSEEPGHLAPFLLAFMLF